MKKPLKRGTYEVIEGYYSFDDKSISEILKDFSTFTVKGRNPDYIKFEERDYDSGYIVAYDAPYSEEDYNRAMDEYNAWLKEDKKEKLILAKANYEKLLAEVENESNRSTR